MYDLFMRLFPSLRVGLLLLLLAALMPAFVLIVHSGIQQRESSVAEMRTHAKEIANITAEEEDRFLAGIRQLLMTLVRLPAFRTDRGAEFRRLGAALIRENPHILNISRFDLDGNIVVGVIAPPGPVNVADRPYFRNALQSGDIAVGDYLIGRMTGKPSLIIAYPIRDTLGKPTAVLNAALDLDWLYRDVAARSGHVPPGGTLTRIDISAPESARRRSAKGRRHGGGRRTRRRLALLCLQPDRPAHRLR